VMTGVPVQDIQQSEKVLFDVRQTIAELVNNQFYATLAKLAKSKGCRFSAESIAPTFMSDGLQQYQYADMPMGEFWVNSPTHDKPNDMFDAISGAHIYGKNIVQAEAFTTLRSDWSEYPGNLKSLGDRAFASGINKLAIHVFMHNPWPDKKPGITLDGIGLFYQRDQTWFKQSKAWIDYLSRCQSLLQLGKPVVDIGVFTGEDLPRRSVLPDRLVNTLPGLFGRDKVAAEKKRLENEGQPTRELPAGVSHSANMADPENYIDALRGYQYDCFNPDVLMKMTVKNGRAVTPGGASYKVLVIPGIHPMNPDGKLSEPVRKKIKQLAAAGIKVIIGNEISGLADGKQILQGPYTKNNLADEGLPADMLVEKSNHPISWTHRRFGGTDIYFLANNSEMPFASIFSFATANKELEIWDPVSGEKHILQRLPEYLKKTSAVIRFLPHQSFFVIFRTNAKTALHENEANQTEEMIAQVNDWDISWKARDGNIKHFLTLKLRDWSMFPDTSLKYYSGHMWYKSNFTIDEINKDKKYWISIDTLHDIATVHINGKETGIVWTAPYQLEISKFLQPGKNKVEILVTNTWRNRLIGDELNPGSRSTWYNSPYSLKNKPLLPAGITGEVKILIR